MAVAHKIESDWPAFAASDRDMETSDSGSLKEQVLKAVRTVHVVA